MPTKRALISSLLLPLALGASLSATSPSYAETSTSAAATAATASTLPTVAVGQRHSLLIAGDGRVYGAGSNDFKQLGSCVSSPDPAFCELAPLPDGKRAVAVAVNFQSSYALSAGGTVYGMGLNDQGQVTGPDLTVDSWHQLSGQPTTVTSLSASNKTVAVTGSDGRAYVAGANSCKLTGGATSFSTLTPMGVYDDENIGARQVSVGNGDFCVVVGTRGKVWGVGDNSAGQITPNNGKLVWLNAPAAGVSVRAAAVGQFSTSVVGSDGNIYSTGANGNYQLGDGTTNPATENKWAQMIGINGHATSVATGATNVLVTTTGGAVYGVGDNSNHALALPGASITVPTMLPGSSFFDAIVEVALSGDGNTSIMRDSTGVVFGSGYSGYSQLASGSGTLTKLTIGNGQVIAPSVAPSVSGTPAVGGTLTAKTGTWSVVPDTYTYQWIRNGVSIPGATGATYTPVAADAGTALNVQVTALRPGFGSASAQTSASKIPAFNQTQPSISGVTVAGHRLTAKKGTWYGAGYTYRYQWLRNGAPIAKATRSTYKLTAQDRTKSISVRVIATKIGFPTVTATSAAKKAQ